MGTHTQHIQTGRSVHALAHKSLDMGSYVGSGYPDDQPLPSDFCAFLPWAFDQFQLPQRLIITRVLQDDYVSVVGDRAKAKGTKKAKSGNASQSAVYDSTDVQDQSENISDIDGDALVRIIAVYRGENLVQIKFQKNKIVPRHVFKLIAIIIKFYPMLNSINVDSGIDMYTAHELCPILAMSNITELSLDDTFVPEANYDILLDIPSNIKCLSLSRCRIGDEGAKNIALKLVYPLPASKTLQALNLSSNKITDISAKYLADALRSNRKISYLNLANNMLTDEGAKLIFRTLRDFEMTPDEIIAMRADYLNYLKRKMEVTDQLFLNYKETTSATGTSKLGARKSISSNKPIPISSNKLIKKGKDMTVDQKEAYLYEKAEIAARDLCGEFENPFHKDIIELRGACYYKGNVSLIYLNLAYNELTYLTLNPLLDVIKCQNRYNRKPGLVNVSLEGNPLPVSCRELRLIDEWFEMGLNTYQNIQVGSKKRMLGRKSVIM